jgi:MFS family permease
VERRTAPSLAGSAPKKERTGLGRFFGVYADPRAWGALFYTLIAFVTGLIYFSWAVVGLSLSVSLAVFIFGLPVALLFTLSVRGIAWLEGRLVEAMLGVRMPRRPLFSPQNIKWQERLKTLITDKHTWFSLLYLITQFVLGTLYFVVLVTIFSLTLTGFAIPIIQVFFNEPTFTTMAGQYYLPDWSYPLTILAGITIWTAMMHIVRWVGGLHGKYAKFMLIADQD